MPSSDTHPTAEALQNRIQAMMTGEQRLLLAYEMSMFARELSRERIRSEHPNWSEKQVALEILRLAFLPAPLPDLR